LLINNNKKLFESDFFI